MSLPPGPEPPPELFHYTTQAGLIGMVHDRHMWATRIQHLSDLTEYRHAFNALEQRCKALLPQVEAPEAKELLESLPMVARQYAGANIYVLCFSELEDSLSQWRSYSSKGVGLAVGFHSSDLMTWAVANGWTLEQCQYDLATQRASLNSLVHVALVQLAKNLQTYGGEPVGRILQITRNEVIQPAFLKLAPRFKHPAFAEEREWRLVSPPIAYDDRNCDVRPGPYLPIPYFKFPIVNNEGRVRFSNIKIGPGTVHETPTPDTMRAADSLHVLLSSHDAVCTGVDFSSAPYRSSP